MANLMFLRKKHIIRTLNEDGTYIDKHYMCEQFGAPSLPSISAAKRASRDLQMANGGLGRGSLKVVEEFPMLGGSPV